MKHFKWGLRLNHDVRTSDRSVPTHKFLKIDPKLLRGGYQAKGGAIYPFTAYQCAENNLYIYIWIWEALQVGFEAHHNVTTSDRPVPTPKFLKIDPLNSGNYQAKGGAIYPFTAYQCAETI